MTTAVDSKLAKRLLSELDADLEPTAGRLGKVKRYLDGDHDKPYAPRGAKEEYKRLADLAITNLLPRIPDAFVKGLFVDGYRAAKSADNAPAWSYWQANGMDARQTITHRGALDYGTSYVLVLPGDTAPVIRPLSPLRSLAWYEDDDAEYPELLLHVRGKDVNGNRLFEIVNDAAVYSCVEERDSGDVVVSTPAEHGMGVTPVVRFRERLGEESPGLVRPLIPVNDRLNEVVFGALIAMQFTSWRQRWATGLAIPTDPDTGEPVEPFKAAVDRLWVTDSAEAKFGDFAQSDMSGFISMFDQTIKILGSMGGVHPGLLFGDLTIANVSEETMKQLSAETRRKRAEYETIFGEAWEQVFALAARADGKAPGTVDKAAQVRWRDTDENALTSTVAALGQMAQLLKVPVEALWERIPDVTDQDLTYWKSLYDAADPLALLAAEVTRQATATATTPTPPPSPATPAQAA